MVKTHHTSFLKSVAQMLGKLHRLKLLLLVIFALLISTSSFSQNVYDNLDTTAAGRATRKQQINSLRKQVLTFIDEFADEEMFDKSLETRRLGKNRTLIDSLESYYDQIGIDFLTLTKLNINQFWAEAFSSRKAYSVNGKIDTLQLLNKTGRTVLFKLQIDSVSSMNDFKINSQVIFGESFKTFLADKNILGLEAEINNYLQQNLNKQTANSPDQYRQPVAEAMSWIYQLFLAKIPTEARQELLNQRDAEDLADEVFTHAYTNFKVDFINPTYGIDSYKATYGTAWENNYQHGFLSDGKSYAIPYVSLNLQATDNFLQAHFTNTKKDTLKIKHLRFKNKDGSYIPPNHITIIDDYTVQINLTAITSKDYLYACWGEKKLGKVRIQPFQPLEKKVMLVPVGKDLNGAELQAIQTTLDKVYKQAVCNWQVDIQEVYTPTEAINLTIPADEGLNQYSRQMREFARTYTTEKNIQLRNTYLIFIIDGFIKETDGTPSDENGYMPRGRDLGFVTHHSLEQTKGITLAHELGHGAFGLKHSWKDEGPAIGKSDNLMDYTANATHLNHKQWKAIHNPLPTVSYLDKVEEGKVVDKFKLVFYEILFSKIKKHGKNVEYAWGDYWKYSENHIEDFNYDKSRYPTYKPFYIGVTSQLWANVDFSKATVTFKESADVRLTGITDNIEFDDIKIIFKETNSEKVALEFDINSLEGVKLFQEKTGYTTLYDKAKEIALNELKNHIDEKKDRDEIEDLARFLGKEVMPELGNIHRIKIVEDFAKNGDYDEEFVFYCFETLAKENIDDFHTSLTSPNKEECILDQLIVRFSDYQSSVTNNDNNYSLFIDLLVEQITKADYSSNKITQLVKQLTTDIQSNYNNKLNVFLWDGSKVDLGFYDRYFEGNFLADYKQLTVLKSRCANINISEKQYRRLPTQYGGYDPQKPSLVAGVSYMPLNDWVFLINTKTNIVNAVPAIYLYFLIDENNNKRIGSVIDVSIHLASIAIGVGEISAASSALRVFLAVTDVTNASAQLADIAFQDEVKDLLGENYQDFKVVTSVLDVVGVGAVSLPVFYKSATKLKETLSSINFSALKDSKTRLFLEDLNLKLGGVNLQGASVSLFKVDNTLKSADEMAGVLINGEYKLNPTAKNVTELKKNPSGAMKLDQSAGSLLNGQYMYVVDETDNIIIGTRAKGFDFSVPDGKAPHPTLIGGVDPTVKTAGIIEFRAGKIYKVDNVSGHYKPSSQSLINAKTLFNQKFSTNNFSDDFQGFILFSN